METPTREKALPEAPGRTRYTGWSVGMQAEFCQGSGVQKREMEEGSPTAGTDLASERPWLQFLLCQWISLSLSFPMYNTGLKCLLHGRVPRIKQGVEILAHKYYCVFCIAAMTS